MKNSSDMCRPFIDKMEVEAIPELAVNTFCHHLRRLFSGNLGLMEEGCIRPTPTLQDADSFQAFEARGRELLERTVVVKLNGGLGTGMGLTKAKSLIAVRNNQTFLDLIAGQVLALERKLGFPVPLILMNSFATKADSLALLGKHTALRRGDLPLDFLQNRVPKVCRTSLLPVSWPEDPDLEWCPPGHGDLYTAMVTSGLLRRLLEGGKEYAFVSNADNLGATIDPGILGYMDDSGIDFLMEAADRTAADRKGGHLCLSAVGRLTLRESAQCPPGDEVHFQDIDRHRYFNTNNIWIHLPSLTEILEKHDSILPLGTIFNRKPVDPRQPESVPVYHIETAMGSAISLFPEPAAVRVPRSRFSPVKATNDLLAVRSDTFVLTEDSRVILAPERTSPPTITLDAIHYRKIDDLEARFPFGPPSLADCDSLDVVGDVTFGRNVRIVGRARVEAEGRGATIPDGSVVEGNITVGGVRQRS